MGQPGPCWVMATPTPLPRYKDGETEAEYAHGLKKHPKREQTPRFQAAQGLLTALLPAELPAPGQHCSPTAGMAGAAHWAG